MARTARRQLVAYTAIPLSVTQVGCAARPVAVPRTPTAPMVRDDDRTRCEEYAKDEVAAFGRPSTTVTVLKAATVGPLAFVGGAVLAPGGGGILWATPFAMINDARGDARSNRALHEQAVNACLELARQELTLGLEHPELADQLDKLASRHGALGARFHQLAQNDAALAQYSGTPAERTAFAGFARRATAQEARSRANLKMAEQLYRRVLVIREKALGPEHVDVATTLESYAALLRKMNRDAGAEEMESRAKAIRASHGEPPPGADSEAQSDHAAGTSSSASVGPSGEVGPVGSLSAPEPECDQ